jgi:hypothetical protein
MKLPPDATFLEAPPLLIWRPRDVLNEASVNRILAFIGEEEAISGKPFDRFTDMSLVDSVDLNFKFIFHVALYRRLSWAGHPKVKSAFYVHTPAVAHYVKLHAVLTDRSSLNVALFEDRETAAKWLGVPVEVLDRGMMGETEGAR